MDNIILDDITVYIFNWKKVSNNSLKLYEIISQIIKDTYIINCDETLILDDKTKHIQLDDSAYYSSQYDHAIKHVKEDKIMCIIVGDNIININFELIFIRAKDIFNKYNVGIYAPNDKKTWHNFENCVHTYFRDNLYNVKNTDCTFWFIHPKIICRLKNIDYKILKYGWGIDIITILEARRLNFLVLRDYSIETDQINNKTNYDDKKAREEIEILEKIYYLTL